MGKEEEIPSFTLNTGASMPAIALGLAVKPGRENREETAAYIRHGLEIGYRHLDTAMLYGTESVLGEVLLDVLTSGRLKREDLFITTKLSPFDTHPGDVIPALRKGLRYTDMFDISQDEQQAAGKIFDMVHGCYLNSELQLEYVDMYLIHFPLRNKRFPSVAAWLSCQSDDKFLPLDLVGVWKELEQCVQLGLTKAIGVSNFSSTRLKEIAADAKMMPAVNQVEMHPGCLQPKLLDTCKKMGTIVTGFFPLGSPGSPGIGTRAVLDSPILKEVAEKHDKTVAQVAIRWILDHGAGVVVKSSNPERMAENLGTVGWSLDEEDHKKIETMPRFRLISGESYCNQTTSPYRTPKDVYDDWYE